MNLGANGMNKTFWAGPKPAPPYFYVMAHLDLAGKAEGTYYFNYDNNFTYATQTTPEYTKFIPIDQNLLISEVTVYSNPPLVLEDELIPVTLTIGGAANTTGGPVVVPWAAPAGEAPVPPPGFVGGPLTVDEVNAGSINYFGHEGGHFPYYLNLAQNPDLSNAYKYLAVTISSEQDTQMLNAQAKARRLRRLNGRSRNARTLPSGPSVLSAGRLAVLLKLYPKEH